MKPKWCWIALMLAVIVAVSFWSVDASAQQGHQPVDRGPLQTWAHRITSIQGWSPWDYAWLSNDRVLAFHQAWGTRAVDQAFEVDVRTGHQQPLDGFNRTLRQLNGVSPWAVRPVLSPDHRWLFWYNPSMGSPGDKWLALRLDGTRALVGKMPYFDFTGGVWSQRSDEWIALYGDKGRLKAFHYPLTSPDAPRNEAPITDTGDLNRFSPILGLTSAGDAIVVDLDLRLKASLNFFAVDLQAGHRPTRSWTVRLPRWAHSERTTVVLSPHADRLAWLFYFDKPYHDRRLTKQCRATFELWISGLDGSNMHMVGYQPIKLAERHILADALFAPCWLPDGHHLSFTTWSVGKHSQDALYTIPVD